MERSDREPVAMTIAADNVRRPAEHERPQNDTGNISAPTIWVMCALVLTVLLIRGAAALQFYIAVPFLTLNFIGFVIWIQYYRR
jgi:hypothetical protein